MKTLIIVFLLFSAHIYSQWQSDVRLTNNTADSYTSYNNAKCIAANGNITHVVWYDSRDGNDEIYYKRSTDGGNSWGTDTRLTNSTANSWFPSIVTDSGNPSLVHLVWQDNRDGNAEIYYKRSTDSGINWGADIRLTINSSSSQNPAISISGSALYVVWYDLRDGNYEIYYKRSTDGGINWEADIRLTNNVSPSLFPSVAVSGSVLHVVWHDTRDGNYEIYCKRSTDGGLNWSADTRLTNSPGNSWFPSVTVSGTGTPAAVHIVWYDNRDGNDEIYYKRSSDGGISWEADARLTSNNAVSGNPSISAGGNGPIHVVWQDMRDGNFEIYYKRSTDGGSSWGNDTRLTNITGISALPSIAISGHALHVVWNDTRDGNYEIYCKRDSTGNPLGIELINSEIPGNYTLSQNYPNPFNPVTNIVFSIPKDGFVELKIYDILGKEVSVLVQEPFEAGSYTVTFDASSLSSGAYFYTLRSGDFTETKKMVLIK